jgi:hypothetical protein
MDIAALKLAAEKATPGPWHVQHDDEVWTDHYVAGTSYHEPDARFIALALANPTSILGGLFQSFVNGATGTPPRMLAVGKVIRAKMQSDRYALFRVTKLDWQSNPNDMFFGEVEDIGYEDGASE